MAKDSRSTTLRIAICGDQNSKESEIGYATSDWVARKTGLKVHRGPSAKYGTIDHVITNANVGRHIVVDGGESDHSSRIVELIDPLKLGDTVNVCYWNVERDRSPAKIEVMLKHLTSLAGNQKLTPDVFCLQEVKQYHNELTAWARRNRFKIYLFEKPDGAWHNTILVRNSMDASHERARQTSKFGWFTSSGVEHTPVVATIVRVAGWLLVASVHETVGVDWKPNKKLARPRGPAKRVAARVTSANSWVWIIRRASKTKRSA